MPTYQYACTECDHAFEQFQSFSDDALTVCPQCSGRLRKVFNAVGVVFKGSGFYRTDSRGAKDDSAPAADRGDKADKPAEKGSGANAGTGSDKGSDRGSDKASDKGSGTGSASSGGEKSHPAKGSDTSSTSKAGSGSSSAA